MATHPLAMVTGIFIPDDGTDDRAELVTIMPGQIAGWLGGWLECIQLDHGVHAYLDVESKSKGLPVNLVASVLAEALGWRGAGTDVLCGPVMFLGDGEDGEEADAPEAAIVTVGRMGII